MDVTSLTGGGKSPDKEQAPALEYTARVTSRLISGEVKLTVGEDGLAAAALFDAAEIPYADMMALELADYVVTVRAEESDWVFSRMGSWCQPFYDALCAAYNEAMLKALFVKDDPILTAKGAYQYAENGPIIQGSAPIHLYENCVCVLPPDVGGRRIPLCFLTGIDRSDYQLTLRLGTDASYAFSKLGYDATSFSNHLERQIRSLREKTLAAVMELDPSLTTAQASEIARRMPEGVAAPLGALAGIAPSFVAALEDRLRGSRAAESYQAFRELCDPARIYVGLKMKAAPGGDAGSGEALDYVNPMDAPNKLFGIEANEGEQSESAPYMLWLIAPSPDGNACAVEFAGDPGDAAATFIYRFDGGFDRFARQLNMALEAIDWKREVIRLTDEELRKPDYARYRMAVQRNAALQFVRSCFVGRVIHSGTWKRKLQEMWEGGAPAPVHAEEAEAPNRRFCTSCGAGAQPSVKFCGQCGAKL